MAEVDISKVRPGQPAAITIDALPDQTFSGVASRIAPTSETDSGVVNYEVSIRLDEVRSAGDDRSTSNLAQVRPGMTAVARLPF